MSSASAVGIYNNFTPGEPCISMWPADYKFPGWIYVQNGIRVHQSGRNHFRNQMFFYIRFYLIRFHPFIVLGRNDDGINTLWLVVGVILNRYLAFAVRAVVWHQLSVFSDMSEMAEQIMRVLKRHWHILICLFICISKHHPLVACTLLLFFTAINSPANILALLMDG